MEANLDIVETLVSLGYSQSQVLQALQISENNAETALELLSSGCIDEPSNPDAANKVSINDSLFTAPVEDRYKMVVMVRMDLGMGIGKIAAQTAHAAVGAYKISPRNTIQNWENDGCAKIVVKVDSLSQLEELSKKAWETGIITYTVRDAGRTQVDPGTVTVCAIGPDKTSKINEVTGKLKLL